MQSYGFKGVPLSYQEARIYHWNQAADRLIGIENIPPELRVAQVIGDEWIYPNDPRRRLLKSATDRGKRLTAAHPIHSTNRKTAMLETKKTFCRFCHVFCGLEVDVQDNRVVAVRGDHDNPVSEGYTCPKGRAEAERINHPDGCAAHSSAWTAALQSIDTLQATAEIGEKLKRIVAEHGPEAVAVYVGCGGHRTAAGGPWYVAKWLQAFGSPRLYTSLTIDSPSLIIAYDRLFGGPLPLSVFDIDRADSAMFVATNPVVSHLWSMPQSNPSTRLKKALNRGLKLVVIDPRRCDVAEKAHVHLQVKPGEDATLLACIIREIIENKWYDAQYVADYVSGFDALYTAVQPFTLDYTQRRTTCAAADIVEAARTFATAASGAALSGTGLHMARHQNLTTQLVQTLNAICGRFDRVGRHDPYRGHAGPGARPHPATSRCRCHCARNNAPGCATSRASPGSLATRRWRPIRWPTRSSRPARARSRR